MTKVKDTTDQLEARIAALTARIRDLNDQWKPHASVSMPSSQSELVVTGQFDPSRLLKKLETASAIDRANVELCELRADLARRQLAELPDGAALEAAQADAERAWHEAQEREQAARRVYLEAKSRRDIHQERVQTLEASVRQAEAQATEWQRTAVKEQAQLDQAKKFRRSA